MSSRHLHAFRKVLEEVKAHISLRRLEIGKKNTCPADENKPTMRAEKGSLLMLILVKRCFT